MDPIQVVAIMDRIQAIGGMLAPGDFVRLLGTPGAAVVTVTGIQRKAIRAVTVVAAVVFALHPPRFFQFVKSLPRSTGGRVVLGQTAHVAAETLRECVEGRFADQRLVVH